MTRTNERLIEIPSPTEIRETLFEIHPDKAPGPDGFSAAFFHPHWDTVGPAICNEIQIFFRTGQLPHSINETHICLIPKIQSPRVVSDYRPIALCNVYYKIISKILSLRLEPILQHVVSENQSAFIPGRIITDNILITHEVLNYLKISTAKKRCGMAIKTDVSKAYDMLECNFIQFVLEKMGFHQTWIHWMMQCIKTVSYSFLINNVVSGKVLPQRGIRQGDPLSPYIFILYGEVLSGLCRKAQSDGTLAGIRVAENSPRINHLLFADDTMIFTYSNAHCCTALSSIVHKYELVSGQKTNPEKYSITFSSKTPPEVKIQVKTLLGIDKESGVGKYLGLQEHFGRKKRDLFASIVDKIKQRSISWTTRFLSTAGKATMLQAVLSSVPTFAMSAFQLPVSLCKKIQSVLTRFWWDSSDGKRKICWVSWENLTNPKSLGGLGFRDIILFNQALLAKIAWRLITKPDCLLARVLLGKYCHKSSFLKVNHSTSSHGWEGILWRRDLLLNHLGKSIGNGETTRVWEDPWIPSAPSPMPYGPIQEKDQDLMVSDLLTRETKEWNVLLINERLPVLLHHIQLIKPSLLGAPDAYIWKADKSSSYSVKSGYNSLHYPCSRPTVPLRRLLTEPQNDPNNNNAAVTVAPDNNSGDFNWKKNVWNIPFSPKLKMFLWKAAQDSLPTGANLSRHGVSSNVNCVHCNCQETTLHALFNCRFAQDVWKL